MIGTKGARVTLKDQTEVIVAVHDQSFAVKSKKATEPQEIDYAHVSRVSHDTFTRGKKVGGVAGVVATAVVIVAAMLTVKLEHSKFPTS